MANDANVKQIEELANFSSRLKELGERMYSAMQQAQKEMNQVSQGWNDRQTEKFRPQFDQSVADIKKMSEQFTEYANHVKQLKYKLDEYKAV